jgi:hypothetical protein
LGQNFDSPKGELKMIASLFDKDNDDTKEENRHSATSASDCEKMAQNHNWELKRVEPTEDRILKVDCIFKGPQTSFQDDWYDHQD